MPKRTVWIYGYTDENDPDGSVYLVFAKQEAALAHAADTVKGLAEAERISFEWQPEDENPEKLAEILKSVSEERHADALAEWEDYRSDAGHRESVSVIEADFIE